MLITFELRRPLTESYMVQPKKEREDYVDQMTVADFWNSILHMYAFYIEMGPTHKKRERERERRLARGKSHQSGKREVALCFLTKTKRSDF